MVSSLKEIEQIYKHPNGSTDVWSIYHRVAAFFDGADLDGENWHAGMTELKNGKLNAVVNSLTIH